MTHFAPVFVDAGRPVELAEPVDDPGGRVGPDAHGSAVGSDGEDVGGAAKGGNANEAAVRAEGDILPEKFTRCHQKSLCRLAQ